MSLSFGEATNNKICSLMAAWGRHSKNARELVINSANSGIIDSATLAKKMQSY